MSNRWMMLTLVPALVLVMSATAFAQAQPSGNGAENAAPNSAAAQSQYEGEDCTEGEYEDGSTNHEDSSAHSQYEDTGHESSAAHCDDTGHEESSAHQGSSGDDQYEEE